MFSNHYTHTLDDEGRLVLPVRWREELGPSVVITRGLDQCLFVFTSDKFERLARQLERLAFAKSDARALSRYLFAEALANSPDEQGRIVLTPPLRAYASLDAQVTIVGVNDRIEIWDPRRYAETDAKIQAEAVTVAERLGEVLQNVLSRNSD
jgi:transcriptional regulator MraZ